MIPFEHEMMQELTELESAGLLRRPVCIASPCEAHVDIDGKSFINAASNNTLGLANHPRIRQAIATALEYWGVGSGASRQVCGDMRIHAELEAALAAMKKTESALLFPTGYMANVGVITALVGKGDTIIADRLAHASLLDGAHLSGARLRTFKHNDPEHLHSMLQKEKQGRVLVLTESIFSMDGDLAPLQEIISRCEAAGAVLVVDEAHATGVLGVNGAGALELLGLEGRVPVIIGTLSKALGGMGGFVAGSTTLTTFLRQKARSAIYTTGPSPLLAAAALEAIRIIHDEPDARQRACQHAKTLYRLLEQARARLHPATFATPPAAHILPVVVGSNEAALRCASVLYNRGILAPAIRPPTVPAGTARIRISCMATHTDEDIQQIAEALLAI